MVHHQTSLVLLASARLLDVTRDATRACLARAPPGADFDTIIDDIRSDWNVGAFSYRQSALRPQSRSREFAILRRSVGCRPRTRHMKPTRWAASLHPPVLLTPSEARSRSALSRAELLDVQRSVNVISRTQDMIRLWVYRRLGEASSTRPKRRQSTPKSKREPNPQYSTTPGNSAS